MPQSIEMEILINAPPSAVWEVLTNPARMETWMGEPEMDLKIETGWKEGSPITIEGFHHVKFTNSGTVLEFEKEKALKYDFLSSVSRLQDTPENHTLIGFTLIPENGGTLLKLELSNFPTEAIRKHNEFYWKATLELLKRTVEHPYIF